VRSYDVIKGIQDLTSLSWDERATSSGTAGTYLKARSGSGSRMLYYKLSHFNGLAIDGHECVNEVVASRLMGLLGIDHVEYRLVHAKVTVDGREFETWLNSSKNFRGRGERKQALGAFYELRKLSDEDPFAFCERYGWANAIKKMMVVDYLIANRDRHASNIEVLVGPDGKPRLAPLFDSGLSLLAPCADDVERAGAFDPLRPVATANFVGSRSLEENLELAADAEGLGTLAESDRAFLFANLEEALPPIYYRKMWEIVWERWQRYADIRTSR